MSTIELAPSVSAQRESRKRWTIDEFDRLMAEGFIREGSRAYLWDGEIYEPMSENHPHLNALSNLVDLLKVCFPAVAWTVNQEGPVILREGYKPPPDVSVLKGPRGRYRTGLPSTSDVVLLAEVSDTTYPDDSGRFLREYAARGIPRYWIVNIQARRVEVYEAPCVSDAGLGSYATRTDFGLDQVIPVVVDLDGTAMNGQVAVLDILRDSLDRSPGQEQD